MWSQNVMPPPPPPPPSGKVLRSRLEVAAHHTSARWMRMLPPATLLIVKPALIVERLMVTFTYAKDAVVCCTRRAEGLVPATSCATPAPRRSARCKARKAAREWSSFDDIRFLDLLSKQQVLIITRKFHQQQQLQTAARHIVHNVLQAPGQRHARARTVQAAQRTANCRS